MKQTISEPDFKNAFRAANRYDSYGPIALSALFEHLLDWEECSGEELELDVIALCCDFSMCALSDLERETGCETLDELSESTLVVWSDDESVLYQAF